MSANAALSRKINTDGSVSEFFMINGDRVTLHYAPDFERESSEETLEHVKEILFQECVDGDKLANPGNN